MCYPYDLTISDKDAMHAVNIEIHNDIFETPCSQSKLYAGNFGIKFPYKINNACKLYGYRYSNADSSSDDELVLPYGGSCYEQASNKYNICQTFN